MRKDVVVVLRLLLTGKSELVVHGRLELAAAKIKFLYCPEAVGGANSPAD